MVTDKINDSKFAKIVLLPGTIFTFVRVLASLRGCKGLLLE